MLKFPKRSKQMPRNMSLIKKYNKFDQENPRSGTNIAIDSYSRTCREMQ